jgi:outer membrane protein assembly factor BamB
MARRNFLVPCRRVSLMLPILLIAASLLTACALSLPTLSQATNQTSESPVHFVIETKICNSNYPTEQCPSVVALDPHTGKRIWHHPLESKVSPRGIPYGIDSTLEPLVVGDLALITYHYHTLFGPDQTRVALDVLDLTSGQLRWRHEVDRYVTGEPVVVGSTIYLSASNISHPYDLFPDIGVVEALDRQSGRLLWSHPVPEEPSPVAVNGDKVFVIETPVPLWAGAQQLSGGGHLHLLALRASDGSTLWDYASDASLAGRVDYNLGTGPVLANQLVYAQTTHAPNSTILALDASDGKIAWQHPTGSFVASLTLSQSADMFCLTSAKPNNQLGSIIAGLDAKTGQTRWSKTIAEAASSCTVAGDTFFLSEIESGGASTSVVALASRDGHQLWHSQSVPWLGKAGEEIPQVAHGFVGQLLTVPANDGTAELAVVYHADSGALAWQHEFHTPVNGAPRVEGDQIYITTPTIQPPYSQTDTVTAFSLRTGTQMWTYETGHL